MILFTYKIIKIGSRWRIHHLDHLHSIWKSVKTEICVGPQLPIDSFRLESWLCTLQI